LISSIFSSEPEEKNTTVAEEMEIKSDSSKNSTELTEIEASFEETPDDDLEVSSE